MSDDVQGIVDAEVARLRAALEDERVNIYADLSDWETYGNNPNAIKADWWRERIKEITKVLGTPVDRDELPNRSFIRREATAIEHDALCVGEDDED